MKPWTPIALLACTTIGFAGGVFVTDHARRGDERAAPVVPAIGVAQRADAAADERPGPTARGAPGQYFVCGLGADDCTPPRDALLALAEAESARGANGFASRGAPGSLSDCTPGRAVLHDDCTRSRAALFTRTTAPEGFERVEIAGRVVSEDTGRPAAGVFVWRDRSSPEEGVRTAADGTFELAAWVPPDAHASLQLHLLADPRGRTRPHDRPQLRRPVEVSLAQARAGTPVTLEARTHAPFSGRVVDAWSNAPAAGLYVRLYGDDESGERVLHAARTDAEGNFAFESALWIADYSLDVTAEPPRSARIRPRATHRLRWTRGSRLHFDDDCSFGRARVLAGPTFERTRRTALPLEESLVLAVSPALRVEPAERLPRSTDVEVVVWRADEDGVEALLRQPGRHSRLGTGVEWVPEPGVAHCLTVAATEGWTASTGWFRDAPPGERELPFTVHEDGELPLPPPAPTPATELAAADPAAATH